MLKVKTSKGTKLDVAYIRDYLDIETIEEIVRNQYSGYNRVVEHVGVELKESMKEYKKGTFFLVCRYFDRGEGELKYILKRGTKKQCERHKRYIEKIKWFDYNFAEYKDPIIMITTIITLIVALVTLIFK